MTSGSRRVFPVYKYMSVCQSQTICSCFMQEKDERGTILTHIVNCGKQIGFLSHCGDLNRSHFQPVLQPLCSTEQRRSTPHRETSGVTQAEEPAVCRARHAEGAFWELTDKSQQRKGNSFEKH